VPGGGATDTLDPNKQLSIPDYSRCTALYSALYETNGDYEPTPLLVEEATAASPDGKVWDLRIRQGAEFHNGKTVSADDLIASMRRLFNPKAPGSGAGAIPWVDPNHLRKMDERTVRFNLKQPVATFVDAISSKLLYIVPVDFDPKKPVGAGPFEYVSFKPGDRSVFRRFANYWDTPAYADELVVIDIKDPTAQVNALLSGDIDATSGIEISQAEQVTSAGNQLLTAPARYFANISMNTLKKPFDDVRVRQAIRLLIDRQAMINQVFSGKGVLGNDLYSRDDPAYASDLPQREQDLEKARALLKAAAQDNLTLEFASSPIGPWSDPMAQVFAEQAKAAGVQVQVRKKDTDTFYSQDYGKAPIQPDSWPNWTYPTVTNLSQLPTSPYNTSNVNNKRFTQLYNQAQRTLDFDARKPILQDMQKIQYDEGAWVIWGWGDSIDALSSKVSGLQNDSKYTLGLNDFHVERMYFTA